MGRNDCFYSQLPDLARLAIPPGMADGLAHLAPPIFCVICYSPGIASISHHQFWSRRHIEALFERRKTREKMNPLSNPPNRPID